MDEQLNKEVDNQFEMKGENEFLRMEERIVSVLKTVYDP